MRIIVGKGLGLIIGMLISITLWAHGYQYLIQVQSRLVLNAAGELSAIEQIWRYDRPTSAILIADLGLSDQSSPAELNALKEQLVQDLTGLAYFTELRFNGVVLPRELVSESDLSLQQGQLVLKLKQPLSSPLRLKGELVIDMADPTGAAIPYHGQVNQVILPAALQAYCQTTIEQRQAIANRAEFEHGKPAEWVKITCAK
ncbi:DUF1007 family protein [Thiofilum flexile]|uniref:DUF1007 family protein n=1 Tax=Thiofilum flexile TaxID=125627 RepID=UPI0003A59CE0|nr:DUF1007 family protein [Thiofilum flexile]